MLVLIKDTVHHDGRVYEPGTTLELDDPAAAALIAAGAAEPAPEPAPVKGKAKAEG